jgi:hypothetical protein
MVHVYLIPTTRNELETFDERDSVKYDLCQKLTLEFHRAEIPMITGSDASAPAQFLHINIRFLEFIHNKITALSIQDLKSFMYHFLDL